MYCRVGDDGGSPGRSDPGSSSSACSCRAQASLAMAVVFDMLCSAALRSNYASTFGRACGASSLERDTWLTGIASSGARQVASPAAEHVHGTAATCSRPSVQGGTVATGPTRAHAYGTQYPVLVVVLLTVVVPFIVKKYASYSVV